MCFLLTHKAPSIRRSSDKAYIFPSSHDYKHQRGTYIKGLIWPPLEPKTENCFHKLLMIGLLEESLKCKLSPFI